ncbi:PREDICTED: putative E3 ubiquitin-protein ligase LIN isoform X2 [Lupinus angustifolius]|uniref:putative E3 ubiquitin-protein ligase LIN isoform X2 n=1 Tax=Lupinus angustifolius TaxID=3871 RepID=UPI00092EE7AF|nr:PREDICTED: putative E3 ubiquitin-protein ligase LIN isoform X2 [Lupinus angustifolius]
MASLRELLTEEGFDLIVSPKYPNLKRLKQKQKLSPETPETKPLPLYICHDRKNIDCSNSKHKGVKANIQKGSLSFHSKTKRVVGSVSETLNSSNSLVSSVSRTIGPLMDEVTIKAVIAILSGYIGRYIKDGFFRKRIRDKCNSYLVRRSKYSESDYEILLKMKLGMENIDKLVQGQGTKKEVMMESLRNSIELLKIVASLNSKTSKNGSTCGLPNSHLSACTQLYIAIVYNLQKNERICARHMLQVFCDSSFLARTYLLPDLWEHLFLPHLLHLKIWYTEELETIKVSNECHGKKEKRMKLLNKVYDNKVDTGTTMFALYYKQWLKVGANEPPLPIVTLPSRPSHISSRRRTNPNLYREVFGPKLEHKPTNLADQGELLKVRWSSGSETDENLDIDENNCSSLQKEDVVSFETSLRQIDKNHVEIRSESEKLDYFQCFSSRASQAGTVVNRSYRSNDASFREETTFLSSEFVGAIRTLCSSEILSECEFSIRVITKVWLSSHGDPLVQEALTQSSVIEGILGVLFASRDDEILELAISVLAELVRRNNAIRETILSSDTHLEIFARLLRSTSLFLKAAILLYLLKPQVKHMLSSEWVPLVLQVLEFGDKMLTLFTVQCNPQVAAIYFLDQLLTGFDEDKNFENARKVASLGGLTLLMRIIEEGEIHDRNNAALIINYCIQAEPSCRSFLADNINKASLLELIVLGHNKNSSGCAFSVLVELLYIDRITNILNFLRGLKDGWGALNTMHIFFIYLQRAPLEERPLVAMILLMLDIMEDPCKCSNLYRAEAIEAVVNALNCQINNDVIKEQSARALLLLAGHFSYTGESLMEKSLLQQAGFLENSLQDSSHGKEIFVHNLAHKNKEEDEDESWRKRTANVLLKNGNKTLLRALANCVANGIPSLAKASLVTISWLSSYLHLVEDRKLPPLVLSIFMPQLVKSLNYDEDIKARVLASYSLLCLVKNSGSVSVLLPLLDKDSLNHLQNLSLVTWTSNELISLLSKTKGKASY